MMKDPVDHILRPQLPWRNDPGITECGLNAAKTPTISRDEYIQRRKDLGQQRTAMTVCMTCAGTAARHGTWADDPRQAVAREIEWETRWRQDKNGIRLRDELLAISALIAAHRDEFDAHILATERRREWLASKDKMAAQKGRPKPRPIGGL